MFTDTVWTQPVEAALHAEDPPVHRDEVRGREEQPGNKKGISRRKPPEKQQKVSKDILLPKAAGQWQPRRVGPLAEGRESMRRNQWRLNGLRATP